MPPAHLWLSFVLASVVLCAIPGPSLLFTIGRALAEGTIRHRRDAEAVLATLEAPRRPARHAIRDGYLVGVTNPKTIVFFIALLPQFVDPARGPVALQMAILGLTFFVIGVPSDGLVAAAAGTARDWFAGSPRRLARMSATGGILMILLGLSLLLTGRPPTPVARTL